MLLVDDDRDLLEGLELTLRRSPYAVLVARSGHEALAVLARRPVDVVVCDEHMPGMSGSELLERIAREYPQIGRVVLTGQPSLDAAIRCINAGRVARFLQKPCSSSDLCESLVAALEAQASGTRCSAARAVEWKLLSAREQEVLTHLLDGRRVAQIARALFVSHHTVRNHLKAVFRKLDVHSQSELLARFRPPATTPGPPV
ncbi:MAG: response regulator [Myxococcales bacterium]|nr:response regulator [Myxococcales bacterium]